MESARPHFILTHRGCLHDLDGLGAQLVTALSSEHK